jgi:arabinosyltransferase C
MPHSLPPSESDAVYGRRFALIAAGVCALVSFLPYLYGLLLQPVGQAYLGYQFNTDDHMVYSAWMRQAQEGRFFFDNRFATDAQPGLTVHLYFFALGLISKAAGLALAAALAKAVFSGLFVWLLFLFLQRLSSNNYFVKLGLSLSVVGGGLGFLVWRQFGENFPGSGHPLAGLMAGRLPTDVWQPEAYVFPSMLTNGLFMVSLCLMLGVFVTALDARSSWRSVPWGFLWMGMLMNIHSYDVLLVALVLVAFLGASLASRTASAIWVVRVLVIGLGAVGPAIWFWHVYQNDPVFQARAATDTFSPNFRQVFFGLAILAGLGLVGILRGCPGDEARPKWRFAAAAVTLAGILALLSASLAPYERFWMGPAAWGLAFAVAVLVAILGSSSTPAFNLALAWAAAGLVAIYFPALFQRKLAMGMSIPWAILAAMGIWQISLKLDRGTRNLVSALAILVLSASSVRWFLREGEYIRQDVSRTTVHPVFLSDDARRIMRYLGDTPGRRVVLAMPGIPSPMADEQGRPVPDRYLTPYMPDLNAIATGLTGAYSHAGHWSETPDYLKRRSETTRFFLTTMSESERLELIRREGVTHVIAPVPAAFDNFYELTRFQLADVSGLGAIVVEGSQFQLIEIR